MLGLEHVTSRGSIMLEYYGRNVGVKIMPTGVKPERFLSGFAWQDTIWRRGELLSQARRADHPAGAAGDRAPRVQQLRVCKQARGVRQAGRALQHKARGPWLPTGAGVICTSCLQAPRVAGRRPSPGRTARAHGSRARRRWWSARGAWRPLTRCGAGCARSFRARRCSSAWTTWTSSRASSSSCRRWGRCWTTTLSGAAG